MNTLLRMKGMWRNMDKTKIAMTTEDPHIFKDIVLVTLLVPKGKWEQLKMLIEELNCEDCEE